MKSNILFLFLLFYPFSIIYSQNTVGVLSYDFDLAYPGINLVYPHNQPNVYLLDNCGKILHLWEDEDNFRPGNVAYIQPNGDLVKAKRENVFLNDPIWAGGGGATVERRTWNNELLWSYTLNDEFSRLHHDIAVLPNGNVLMIAWNLKTFDEAVQAGRNPALLAEDELWQEKIIEYDPVQEAIVWEWQVWDHLIQGFDSEKDNFGNVAEHPELIDINFDTHDGHPDWLHCNAIAYNPVLDQIALSIPYFNEVWIIDHSTTTTEAASHLGGNANKGGDLLFRWGNPIAYQQTGEVQKLFFQHDVHWKNPNAQSGETDFGQLVLFNNRVETTLSTVNTIQPVFDPLNGFNYLLDQNTFLPDDFSATYTHPNMPNIAASTGLSGAQFLPNGNLLVLAGRWGYAYELTPDNQIAWEYRVPIAAGQPIEQGDSLSINDNITFRLGRYPLDFPAFQNNSFTMDEYWEINPNTTLCDMTVSINESNLKSDLQLDLIPNLIQNTAILSCNIENRFFTLHVVDFQGNTIGSIKDVQNNTVLDFTKLVPGMYFIFNSQLNIYLKFIKI